LYGYIEEKNMTSIIFFSDVYQIQVYVDNAILHCQIKQNMKTIQIKMINNLTRLMLVCLFTISVAITLKAQINYTIKDKPILTISGTSTLHDWDMQSSTATCNATFVLNAALQITGVNTINFSMPVADLKSKHTAMDNNAYKALGKDKNPNITFVLTPGTATFVNIGAGNYTLKCRGKLTIAGTAVDTDLTANCKVNADKTITVTGSKNISMKDYSVKPPSFMMGAVKTGNDIVLKFNLTMK
jgi:hypothetical protein